MKLVNNLRVTNLLTQLKQFFGFKSVLDKNIEARNKYLLNIDYDADLKFDTNFLVGESAAPYVGQAVVGSTYVAQEAKNYAFIMPGTCAKNSCSIFL